MVSRFNNFIRLHKVTPKLVLFLSVLIIFSAWLRFHNFTHLLYWMFDEERDAFIIKKIIIDHHPTLIGGSIPGGFYLAPGYFYVSTIFYFFSNLNPIGPAVAASTLGVISTLLLFLVSKIFFNKKVAVFSSLIYCTSFLVTIYNRTWWPLTFGPTLSILTYFALYKIIKEKNYRYSLLLLVTFTIGAQSDPSNFSLIALVVIAWFLYKLTIKNKYVIASISLFFLSHAPLLLFDFRHNFLNTRQLLKMLTFGSAAGDIHPLLALKALAILPQTIARLIYISISPDVILQIIPTDFYVRQKVQSISPLLLAFSIIVLIWFFVKFLRSKKSLPIFLIGLHVIVGVSGVIFYNLFFPGYTHEWFFQVLFPALVIILGLFLFEITKTKFAKVSWLALSVYLFFGILSQVNAKNSYSFADKSSAVKWAIKNVGDQPFSLDSLGQNFSYGGYRYLFYLYGREPVKSYMDPVFADWLYPKSSLWKNHPNKVVVIVNPDFFYDSSFYEKYNIYLAKTDFKKQFGKIEVLIIDNSQKWVHW